MTNNLTWQSAAEACGSMLETVTAERDELRAEVEQWREKAQVRQEVLELRDAEVERLCAALEKIADTQGNVHSSWLIGDARRALGRELLGRTVSLPHPGDERGEVQQAGCGRLRPGRSICPADR